jgi:CubicO group peptidase (beta-lactamase class C family)
MKNLIQKIAVVTCMAFVFRGPIAMASIESDQISELLQDKLKIEKSVVGASIVIIDGNNIEYINVGLINKQKQQMTHSDHLFEIGSISKTFTSLALASMVNEGRVKLTDSLQKYLPEGVKLEVKNDKPITLLSLSNHTSGLPRLPSNMPFSDPLDPYADYTVEMMYQFLNAYQPSRDVGEKVDYSNLGAGLLGHVLARFDGKTYQQMITERVLKPLGMRNTFVDVPSEKLAIFSHGHDADLNKTKHWQLPTLAGAGAIKSSAKDMLKYLNANMQSNLLTQAISLTHQETSQQRDNSPKVALAWFINQQDNGSYLWHNGGTGGFRSFIGFDKKQNKGIVILDNTVNGMDDIGHAYLMGTVGKLKVETSETILVDKKVLTKLNGQFELVPGFIITVTNQGTQLLVQATGQPQLPFASISESSFINRQAKAKITFEVDSNAKAISLTLHQGGTAQKARRLSDEEAEKNNTQTQTVSLSETQLQNLVGEFQLMPEFTLTITVENSQLIVQATGQGKNAFDAESKSEFSNQALQAKIVFELDQQAKAISLTLLQGGQTLRGKRL